jgi:tetratricopeptide (TPR) repeat protein
VFAAGEGTLIPTGHPPVPPDPSLLWLAPARNDRVSLSPALTRFTSGVALYKTGKYAEALRLLSSRSSLPRPAADYASYYSAQAELKLGRPDVARREFTALSARLPAGYLWEAALIGEAEAAAAAGDHAGSQRLYERLLTRTPMAPDDGWFRLGRAAQAAGNVARAVTAFTQLYEQFPLSRYTPDAMSALPALQGLDPLTAGNARYRLEFHRASLLFDAKQYEEARAAFERLRPYASAVERERVDVRMAACYYFAKQYAKTRTTLGR